MGKLEQQNSALPVEPVAEHHDPKHDGETAINQQERDLTLGEAFRNHKTLIWWCFYWAMCAVGWGFDAQINGNMIAVEAFRRDFGYVADDGKAILPAEWQTAFNVVPTVGQFFGGFLCSWVSDRIGRRGGLVLGLLFAGGGAIGEIFAETRGAFLGSKIVLGFGLSFYLTLAPLATSEIAPVALRGYATSGVNLGIAIGQLLSNAVVKAFSDRKDNWAYRGPFATQLFFVIFLAVCLPFLPETPWYLARKGKKEQAIKAIKQLFGRDYDAETRLRGLEATIEEEQRSKAAQGRLIDCFRGTNLLRTGISTGVFLCQHLVGIIFVLGYSTYFFQLAGLPESQSFDLSVGVTACGVAGNMTSWFVVERFGRRTVFLTGMVTLTALLMLIGILDVVPTGAASWVQAGATVVYAFIYFLTIGAMAFAILGEASSTTLRAKTISLATATQALCGIVFNFAIPYMVNPDQGDMRGKVGFVFGGLGLIGTLACWMYVPELKGKTFDEIDRLFEAKVPPRRMGDH